MNDAIKALTANGLVKMHGVRGESYVYRSDGKATFVDLKDTKFYAQGEISHLPSVIGYSESEIAYAVYCATDDNATVRQVLDNIRQNRKERVTNDR